MFGLLAQSRYCYFYFSKNLRKTQGRLYSLHQCMGPYLEKNRSLQLWINPLIFPILELISLFQLMFFFCNFGVLLKINSNHNAPNYYTYTCIYHVYILCNYIYIYNIYSIDIRKQTIYVYNYIYINTYPHPHEMQCVQTIGMYDVPPFVRRQFPSQNGWSSYSTLHVLLHWLTVSIHPCKSRIQNNQGPLTNPLVS